MLEVFMNNTAPAANELPKLPPAVYSDVTLDQSQQPPQWGSLCAFERREGDSMSSSVSQLEVGQ